MNPLVDRITEVLRDHVRIRYVDGIPFCECGAQWIGPDHAAHVAEQIAALFTEEHGYQIDGEHADEPDAWFPAADYNTSRPVSHRRWVSAWTAVEDQSGAVECPCVGAGPPAEWCWIGAAPHCRHHMPNRNETNR